MLSTAFSERCCNYVVTSISRYNGLKKISGGEILPLSDSACKAAKAQPKAYRLTDGHGLYLLVQPNGSKLWQLIYRFQGSKQRTLSMGKYPIVSLADAREIRTKALNGLAHGRDPAEAKKGVVPDGATFEHVASEWHAVWKVGKTAAHAERVWARLKRDGFTEIGSKDIRSITSADILRMVRKVEARGNIDTSKRLKSDVSNVFQFAIPDGKASIDPTHGLNRALKAKPKVRHHAALSPAGLGELTLQIDHYDGETVTRLGLQFTLLTAVRTKETRFMRWEEIDGAMWRIPPERMKMKRPHIVPLSKQALEVLAEVRKLSRGDLVFSTDDTAMSENTMLFALYRMGYHGKQTVHGLRTLFSTIANEKGWNADWIEMQLAHDEEDDSREAYNAAEYLPGRTEMLQWWADYVDGERYKAVIG
ncbi:MAG: integrase [Sphingomonas sp.]|nr:MAG: integrase [Sphingomonas sp.]